MLHAIVLLAAACGGVRAAELQPFPRANEVFHRLLADPRQIQLSGAYYRMDGQEQADVALGHSWGLLRGLQGPGGRRVWQWDVEGMAYSRFRLHEGVNEFETVDFFANLPLSVRQDGVSGKLVLFHESSHLGDDYIRRTHDEGFRYSREGLRALLSADAWREAVRVYGGGAYLLHEIPAAGRGQLQAGLELRGCPKKIASRSLSFYLAQDLGWREEVGWNPTSHSVAGLRLAFKDYTRAMRFHVGYFTGHSAFGQFFPRREAHWDFGLDFEL
ncbi:MAG: DUF1207 domain-containing protein [Elusimicrobia bacterium]|nr:DUF1207 domain-containing protein [Elusimicrobiota bacterium]